MRRQLIAALPLSLLAFLLSACVVAAPGPPPQQGWHWVPYHCGAYGNCVPGHWAP